MSDKTLTVPIGPNASIDGGPFANFEGDGIEGDTAPEAGVLVGVAEGEQRHETTPEDIQDAFADEMREDQPLRLSTGDADEAEMRVGTVELPLVRGYTVTVYNLKGGSWALDTLGDKYTRKNVERKLRRHGGIVASV